MLLYMYTCIHGGNDKLGSVFGHVWVLHVEFCHVAVTMAMV